MDPLTHGITGALIAKAFFAETPVARVFRRGDFPTSGQDPASPRQFARITVVVTTIAAIFPDIDILFEPFVPSRMATLELHRGVTHSFACLPLFALGLALLTRWILFYYKKESPSWPALTLMYATGLASHILLDLITSWGTMMWAPLTNTRYQIDLVFIIDFLLTAILLLPQVAAWVYRAPHNFRLRALAMWGLFTACAFGVREVARVLRVPFSPWTIPVISVVLATLFFAPAVRGWGFGVRRASWCRAGLCVVAVYLLLCVVAHQHALARVEQFAAAQGLHVEQMGALPLPPSLARWAGLIRTPDGVYQAVFGVWDAAPRFEFVADSPANRYIEAARQLPEIHTYLWFARFPVVRYVESATDGRHVVEFNDLRFIQRRASSPAPFEYRVVLDAAGHVVEQGWVD